VATWALARLEGAKLEVASRAAANAVANFIMTSF
jgi:hypothetical protein